MPTHKSEKPIKKNINDDSRFIDPSYCFITNLLASQLSHIYPKLSHRGISMGGNVDEVSRRGQDGLYSRKNY